MRPNWDKNAWQRSTAQRIRPTPGCRVWPRLGASLRKPAVAARSLLGRFPYAPSARERGRSRGSGGTTGASAGGGWTPSDSSTAGVSTRSLTLAALMTAPRGIP